MCNNRLTTNLKKSKYTPSIYWCFGRFFSFRCQTQEENGSVSAIFSHAAAYLGHGLPISEIGPVVANFSRKLVIQPVITSNQIRATIIHIDHFENAVVNLRKDMFERVRNERNFALYYKQNDPITFLSKDYGDVAIGDALAFFNSAGYLEIAINMDKASSMLNLFKNEMIQINFY